MQSRCTRIDQLLLLHRLLVPAPKSIPPLPWWFGMPSLLPWWWDHQLAAPEMLGELSRFQIKYACEVGRGFLFLTERWPWEIPDA